MNSKKYDIILITTVNVYHQISYFWDNYFEFHLNNVYFD